MQLILYWTAKGHDWDKVSAAITASSATRDFLYAGAEFLEEREAEKYKTMLGGDG